MLPSWRSSGTRGKGVRRVDRDYDPAPAITNHTGGKLAFGPDGHLYIGVGYGDSDLFNAARTLSDRQERVFMVAPRRCGLSNLRQKGDALRTVDAGFQSA